MAEFTYSLPEGGVARGLTDATVKSALSALKTGLNGNLDGSNLKAEGVELGDLVKAAKPITWYTPKIIATEQTRENAAFGTLTTADEIKEVVVPENGFILVEYFMNMKSSVENNTRAAIFLGANQLKKLDNSAVAESTESKTTFRSWTISPSGGMTISSSGTESSAAATTGQVMSSGGCKIMTAAGTYNVSIQFKTTSGSVTAKERKLWVTVFGY